MSDAAEPDILINVIRVDRLEGDSRVLGHADVELVIGSLVLLVGPYRIVSANGKPRIYPPEVRTRAGWRDAIRLPRSIAERVGDAVVEAWAKSKYSGARG